MESFKQPEMRYKPRTDLERIFDTVNNNNYGRVNKSIVYNQLKGLELNQFKRQKTYSEDEDEEYEKLTEESPYIALAKMNKKNKAGTESSSVQTELKEKAPIRKRFQPIRNINAEAKYIMSDLHYKTHFKAAAVFASQYPSLIKKESQELQNGIQRSLFEDNEYATMTQNRLVNSNQILRKNVNPYQILNTFNDIDPQALIALQQIAFKDPNDLGLFTKEINQGENVVKGQLPKRKRKVSIRDIPEQLSKQDPNHMDEELFNKKGKIYNLRVDDEKIMIGSESLSKSKINEIANKILNACNVYHSKNKNNKNCLKAGSGKLMITNGLTIKEFEDKYILN